MSSMENFAYFLAGTGFGGLVIFCLIAIWYSRGEDR